MSDGLARGPKTLLAVSDRLGSSPINRAAVRLEVCNGACLTCMHSMFAASDSIAASRGCSASEAASVQGSRPRRANTERIVNPEPFGSVPTLANRKGLRLDFPRANTSAFKIDPSSAKRSPAQEQRHGNKGSAASCDPIWVSVRLLRRCHGFRLSRPTPGPQLRPLKSSFEFQLPGICPSPKASETTHAVGRKRRTSQGAECTSSHDGNSGLRQGTAGATKREVGSFERQMGSCLRARG